MQTIINYCLHLFSFKNKTTKLFKMNFCENLYFTTTGESSVDKDIINTVVKRCCPKAIRTLDYASQQLSKEDNYFYKNKYIRTVLKYFISDDIYWNLNKNIIKEVAKIYKCQNNEDLFIIMRPFFKTFFEDALEELDLDHTFLIDCIDFHLTQKPFSHICEQSVKRVNKRKAEEQLVKK